MNKTQGFDLQMTAEYVPYLRRNYKLPSAPKRRIVWLSPKVLK